jgi:hypothetical protein
MPYDSPVTRVLAVTIGLCWAASGCMPATQTSGGQGASPGSGGKTVTGGSGGTTSAGGSGGTASGGSGGATSSGGTQTGGSAASGGASSGGSGGRGGTTGRGGSNTGGRGGSGGSGGSSTTGTGGGSGGARSGGAGGGGGTGGGGSGAGGSGGAGGTTSSGGTVVGGAGGSTAGGLTLAGLKIEANPKNALSAFVSWTTDKAADSVVQFGQGKYEWEVSDSAEVTSHKVLIIGMYANKAYQIKAISSANGSTGSATGNFTAGSLPAQIPVATIGVNDTAKVQPGWTLMNIIKSGSTMGPISNDPSAAVIYDATGQPVWYYINGTTADFGGAISTYLTDKGVLIGPVMSSNGTGESPREVDFAGNTVWECKDPRCGGTGDLTHDTIKLPNGNHVVLRWKEIGSGANLDSDATFEELDASGNVVWSMNFSKLVPKPSGASGDWCHGNSIVIDIEKDVVYGNCRFMGLVKTSYKNPNSLIWYLPASYGKATGNMVFSPTTSQYSDTHDPEFHADDSTLLVFDNGGYSTGFGGPTTTYHSRAVEYKIDENAKTATLVWEFPGNFNVDSWYKNNWYNAYFGDADRLANGNVLIAAGSVSQNTGDARVFEVQKADGKVVWEFKLPASFGVYRAERIDPPLVHAITTQ